MNTTPTSVKFPSKHFFTATALAIGNLFGTLISTSQPSQAVVIGQDERVTPTYEWMTRLGQQRSAVGHLEVQVATGQYIWCTFTVVGRNIGLTNTHCLLDEQGRVPRQIKAFAVQHGGRVLAAANVDIFWTGLDASPTTVEKSVRDWAVIRFTSNLGDITGWYGNVSWNRNNINDAGQSAVNQTTYYIGYSGDWPTNVAFKAGDVKGQTPASHFGCKIVAREAGLLLHDCDTNPRASGSSLYSAFSDTDLRTLGLHNGSINDANGLEINTAVPLERFMPAVETLRATRAASNTTVPRP